MRASRLIVGSIVAVVLGTAFYQLAGVYDTSPAVGTFDAVVGGWIHGWRADWLTPPMRTITWFGDTLAVTLATVVLALIVLRFGTYKRAIYAAATVGVGAWLTEISKQVLSRARPPLAEALIDLPDSFSFPSGHTMASLCLAWAVSYVVLRSAATRQAKAAILVAAATYAIAVALSRVYLGVHWPSDVVASWLLGGAWIALSTGIYESVRLRKPAETSA